MSLAGECHGICFGGFDNLTGQSQECQNLRALPAKIDRSWNLGLRLTTEGGGILDINGFIVNTLTRTAILRNLVAGQQLLLHIHV